MPSHHPQEAIAFCPHCGNDSPQRVVSQYSRFLDRKEGWVYYVLICCQTCQAPLLYNYGAESPGSDSWGFTLDGKELLWPLAKTLHDCVPRRIKEVYEEAARVKRRAPNAFANQIRRSLEALCNDRGASGRNLNDSLRKLSEQGEIPSVLAEMSDVLRLFGNMGSHDGDISVGPEQVDVIDDFFRAVVEYVYVAPHRIDEVRAQLEGLQSNQS